MDFYSANCTRMATYQRLLRLQKAAGSPTNGSQSLGGEIQLLRSKGRYVAEYKPRPKTPEQLRFVLP